MKILKTDSEIIHESMKAFKKDDENELESYLKTLSASKRSKTKKVVMNSPYKVLLNIMKNTISISYAYDKLNQSEQKITDLQDKLYFIGKLLLNYSKENPIKGLEHKTTPKIAALMTITIIMEELFKKRIIKESVYSLYLQILRTRHSLSPWDIHPFDNTNHYVEKPPFIFQEIDIHTLEKMEAELEITLSKPVPKLHEVELAV